MQHQRIIYLIGFSIKPSMQLTKNLDFNAKLSSENDIASANAFSKCVVHVLNFCGLDINFEILTTPIVLLRYVSFADE